MLWLCNRHAKQCQKVTYGLNKKKMLMLNDNAKFL